MKRINLYGGPGCGKSVTAAKLFYELKIMGTKVELAREYIKKWAYLGRTPKSFDQVYVFGHQLHEEDYLAQSGIDVVITDSPLIMQCAYAKIYNFSPWPELLSIAQQYEHHHESIHIFLSREGIEYQTEGRYETHDLALQRDKVIRKFLVDGFITVHDVETRDFDSILELVKGFIND